jgi:hypothetical protein
MPDVCIVIAWNKNFAANLQEKQCTKHSHKTLKNFNEWIGFTAQKWDS